MFFTQWRDLESNILSCFRGDPLSSPFVDPSLSAPVPSLSPHHSWLDLHISYHVLPFPEASRYCSVSLLHAPAGQTIWWLENFSQISSCHCLTSYHMNPLYHLPSLRSHGYKTVLMVSIWGVAEVRRVQIYICPLGVINNLLCGNCSYFCDLIFQTQ